MSTNNIKSSAKNLTEDEKARILAYKDIGYSIRNISNLTGRSVNTILKWTNRDEFEGNTERKTGSGKKRTTTEQENKIIIEHIRKNPRLTLTKLKSVLESENNIKISEDTIRRRLSENGIFFAISLTLSEQSQFGELKP